MTDHPFALNQVVPAFLPEIHKTIANARPKVISFALDDPGDLVIRGHDIGALVMHQVTNVAQAVQAAERGVDIIVAQGSEAGGYSGKVATLPLVPQVVDAVHPIPVLAAGGIFDGRGIAAALMLGAVGVNMGTRFLSTPEAPFEEWKAPILDANSEDAVHVDIFNYATPMPGAQGYGTVIRGIRTPVLNDMISKSEKTIRPAQILAALSGDNKANMPVAGQSVGGISELVPARELVRRLVSEAEKALSRR
jgi:nitronate monooxygenase/enoyl-[acyl-carrier protein] reductase II